jgi:predicted transposase/invertase (TIGR01784 family)
MSPRRTLDPTLDVVFKMLLTRTPQSHELLVALLTAVIRPPTPFAKVVVRNPELPPIDVIERGVVLDLHAQLEDGTLLDIEMQSDKRPAFRERALFYWARLYGSELERGDDYHALRPVIAVLFLDYRELRGARLHSTFEVLEVHDHERFSNALTLHVIELPKIPQATAQEHRDEADLIRWSRFFAAKTDEELQEVAMGDPVIEKARQVLQIVSDDPMAREVARLRYTAEVTRRIEEAARRAEMDAARAEAEAARERADAERERANAERERANAERERAARADAARAEADAARAEADAARAESLRRSIVALAGAHGVAVDESRRDAIARSDVATLQGIFDVLVRDRIWPV